MATKYANIYEYVKTQEAQFDQPIDIHGWTWSMKDHIRQAFFYKHGRLLEGNDDDTPVMNIVRPLLNLQYRAEDIDVEDVEIYVDDPQYYFMSFLVKKYHDDVFLKQNDLDTFFDELKESKVDTGGGLAKKMQGARPERVDLRSIVFCDQTDMLKGPIGIKHHYNPAELMEMKSMGWGDERNGANITIEDLIEVAEDKKDEDSQDGISNKTTGVYIEVYEVHGVLPMSFMDPEKSDLEYERQMHIVAFYHDKDGMRHGVTLFAKKEIESPFKLHKRDDIWGRALGYGGVEELAEDQVWANNDVIRMQDILDSASKTILKSVGADLKSRYPNGLQNLKNLSIVELNEGEDIGQIDTTPRQMALFQNSLVKWEEHARQTASATEALLGEQPNAGTPFRSQERQVIEAKGLHNYRKEKFARFIEEVYNDWIIPHIQNEIVKGTKFLSELSTEELRKVTDAVVQREANKFIKEQILSGKLITKEQVAMLKDQVRQNFTKSGNKKFIEILKDEFKKKPLRVKVSVAGNKDLATMTEKLVNIFRQIIANPQGFQQIMQIPEMARTFNEILEFSGISPIVYAGITEGQATQPKPQQAPQGIQPQLEAPLPSNQQ